MKCKSCGGEVPSDQERCPFCNTVNETFVKRNKKMRSKIHDNKKLREQVLEHSKEYICNKILNRSMIILAALFVLLLSIGFITYGVTEGKMQIFHNTEEVTGQLAETYESREFNKLYSLLEKYDIFGAEYYQYSQMALFHFRYEKFIDYRNECIEEIENNKIPDDYHIENVLDYGYEILHPYIPNYSEVGEDNRKILSGYQLSVMAFFQTYLRLEENEIADLYPGKENLRVSYSEIESLRILVKERLGV